MADNLTTQTSTLATVPSGSVIGTDEVTIGAVLQHVQRVKLVDGSDGGTGLIGGDAANGLDVDVTRVPAPLSTTGGGTEATALRVTVATDSTGVLSVDDNGASLTVDGTVAATQSGTWTVQPGNTANTTAWLVTGTGGTFPVTDSGGSLTVDGTVAVSGTVTTSDTATQVDDAAFTPATGRVMMIGATFDAVTPDTVDEGDGGALRMNADRALHTSIRDSAGNNRGANVNASGELLVAITANSAVNVAQVNGVAPSMGNGASGTGVQRVTIANDSTGTVAVTQATASSLNAQVVGNIAHDGADSGNPVGIGLRALAHGTNPTAVAAADRTVWYANRAGVPWVIGGHPNIVTVEAAYTAAQTDTAVVTVGAGVKIVVTQIQVTCDNANTVDVGIRVGFGTANTPTTTGVVLTHPGIPAGSGVSRGDGSGIIGIGADNEDLRCTCEVPTTGSVRVLVSYYTIES